MWVKVKTSGRVKGKGKVRDEDWKEKFHMLARSHAEVERSQCKKNKKMVMPVLLCVAIHYVTKHQLCLSFPVKGVEWTSREYQAQKSSYQ